MERTGASFVEVEHFLICETPNRESKKTTVLRQERYEGQGNVFKNDRYFGHLLRGAWWYAEHHPR